MGQRHQIYLATPQCHACLERAREAGDAPPDGRVYPDCYVCDGRGHEYDRVVGIHHQWLYGATAIQQAARMLKFLRETCEKPNPRFYYEPGKILAGVYSCIPEDGYYHDVQKLDDGECEDPRRGDNNDGITILDARRIRDGVVGYAFMRLEFGDTCVSRLPAFVPQSAAQYVDAYYPPGSEKRIKFDGGDQPISGTLVDLDGTGAELLTSKHVAEIFPALARDLKKAERRRERARKSANDAEV